MLGLLRAGRPDDATGVLGTWRDSLLRLFSNIRPILLDAVAFARNVCCSRSALAAENFSRKTIACEHDCKRGTAVITKGLRDRRSNNARGRMCPAVCGPACRAT